LLRHYDQSDRHSAYRCMKSSYCRHHGTTWLCRRDSSNSWCRLSTMNGKRWVSSKTNWKMRSRI